MAYFFRQINTLASSAKSERREVIYNLDEFHIISRLGRKITASRVGEKPVLIASCRSDEGAEYVMQCILAGQQVDSNELSYIEMRIPF